MRHHRSTPRSGFTFIEALIVFSVIAILGTMSVGKINRWITKSTLERASQTMRMDLASAFALAVRNNAPVVVTISKWTTGDSIRLRLASRSGTVFRNRYFGARSQYGIHASEMTPFATTFEVYPMGVASSVDTITFSRNGATRRVIMSRAGIVTVDK
jgi:Tfp pilus assembly protein FimT